MHTTENREADRLERSDPTDAQREDDVHRVQEAGEQPNANAEAHSADGEDDGLFVRGSRQFQPVSNPTDSLEGFLANEWVPAEYQVRAAHWLAERPAGALFLVPGMGKTSASLEAFRLVRELNPKARMLVLAPLTVCLTTWMAEPSKWRQFSNYKIGLAHGPDKSLVLQDDYYDIVVMNYDGIAWATPILLKGHNFEVLLCDEITRMKNTSSKRFKLLKPLLLSSLCMVKDLIYNQYQKILLDL